MCVAVLAAPRSLATELSRLEAVQCPVPEPPVYRLLATATVPLQGVGYV